MGVSPDNLVGDGVGSEGALVAYYGERDARTRLKGSEELYIRPVARVTPAPVFRTRATAFWYAR